MIPGTIKSVIFDLDGTLIDTEKYYRRAWPEALKHFGYTMTDDQALAMRSLGRPYSPALLKEWFGEDFDYTKIRGYRKVLVEDMMAREGINLKPGALETLTALRDRGIRTAMATANDYERAERYLKKIGLFEYFDEIICADHVEKGKPSPDIYLYACRELNLDPAECFAVEDSPNGVKSASSAGCRTIMVPDQTEPDEELKKLLFARIDRLDEIMDLLY